LGSDPPGGSDPTWRRSREPGAFVSLTASRNWSNTRATRCRPT